MEPVTGARSITRRCASRLRLFPLAMAALGLLAAATQVVAQEACEGARRFEWSCASNGPAVVRQAEGWQVFLSPYLWASGLEGVVGSRGRSTRVDLGFRDIVEDLDGALMLPIEIRKARWGLLSELILIRLSSQSGTPGPLFSGVELGTDETLIQLLPFYRVVSQETVALDLLAGGRLWHIGAELIFRSDGLPDVVIDATERWIDPVIGVRTSADIGKSWRVQGYADIGGFGIGSDFTWQLLGTVGYHIGGGTVLRFGYRQLDVDFDDRDNGFIFDTGTGGWILGVTIWL
mgnify:CR=1 FL=1